MSGSRAKARRPLGDTVGKVWKVQKVSKLVEILQNVSNVGAAVRTADLWPQLKVLSERLGAQSILVIANRQTDEGWTPKVLNSVSPFGADLLISFDELQSDPLFLRSMSDTAVRES